MADYAEEEIAEEEIDESGLKKLTELAGLLGMEKAQLAKEENAVKERKDNIKQYEERLIPDLMEQLDLANFTTHGGVVIKIEDFLRTSIAAARKLEAFKWLRDHGYGGIIKNTVSITFGKGEDQAAEVLMKAMAKEYPDKSSAARTVAAPTLKATMKGLLEEGEDVPKDLFGIFQGKRAKIK
jgi:hypothetical protein